MTTNDNIADQLAQIRLQALIKPPHFMIEQRVGFSDNYAITVPETSGCYLIADDRGPLYVGQAIQLRKRFGEHLRHSHNPNLRLALENPWGTITFGWMHVPSAELTTVELRLITFLQPICNIAHNTVVVDPRNARRALPKGPTS